jgi:hypothetical protein
MRDEKLTTSDFLAAGERNTITEIPIEDQADRGIDAALDHRNEITASTGGGGAQMAKAPPPTPLFQDTEAQDFRSRWDHIQIAFVDEPQQAVKDADNLVAETMKRLAEVFTDERKKLETQWGRGDDVSTENLRIALQRYRSFFNRLLAM